MEARVQASCPLATEARPPNKAIISSLHTMDSWRFPDYLARTKKSRVSRGPRESSSAQHRN